MKQILIALPLLILSSCSTNFTGSYETLHMHKVVKKNTFMPKSKGILSMYPSAIYKDFAPLKLTLQKNADSYSGNVEMYSTQGVSLLGRTEDTSSVIMQIVSSSMSNDTLNFIFEQDGGFMGRVNLKGFITKEKGKMRLGFDQRIMEELPDNTMNPFLLETNAQFFVYKEGEISSRLQTKSYKIQRNILETELGKESNKYSRRSIQSTIVYMDSLLLK